MRLTVDELRVSVTAVADTVAVAYTRFDPPFDDREVADRFAQLPGAHPTVSERLATTYCSTFAEVGDGEKAAVLIACGIVRAALARLPAEGRQNLSTAIDMAASRPAEWVETAAQIVYKPAEVARVATTAAAGDAAIGSAICEALRRAGPDGMINVNRGERDEPPGVTVIDGETVGERGRIETVVVRCETEFETTALYYRAVTALHAAVASVAGGIVPGGGVAYVLAGEALRGEGEEDTIMWLAARAVLIGLETPFRLRAAHAGLNPDTLLVALRNDPTQAFDQTERKLVPFAYGPVDAARVVQRAIREAGRTACDLLRMAL